MPTNKAFISNIDEQGQSGAYLQRPRLNKLLESAANYPLVAVYAGSGYGKTRAVYSFLQECGAHTTWIQLTERDNVVARFWENYVHMISLSWPEIGARFAEIGFPDTEEAFSKYAQLRSHAFDSHANKKFFFVYDDFHLLQNPVILRTFEKIAGTIPPGGTVILLSRTIPEINLTAMMLKERVFTISEDELCFTEDEIFEYFCQLGLLVTRQEIRDIYDDTKGWALAVNLIGRSLGKNKKYERYALAAMKENIFRLVENEMSELKDGPLWRFLLRISLIDQLAADLIRILADDDALIKELNALNAYVRYDYHLGAYMIHNLFLEYLRQNQDMLSKEEKRDTYNTAGAWCEAHNYQSDALEYYEKAENYDAILNIINMQNLQLSQDMARYALEIFERIPKDEGKKRPTFPALDLKIKICLGMLKEASEAAQSYAEEYASRPPSPENNQALTGIYNAWAVLRMIMSPNTHVYDFDVYFKKMREYFDKSPYEATGSSTRQAVGAYATLVGTNRAGAPDEYIEALTRAIPHADHVLNGCMYGLDDLARGELYYNQRNLNGAERYFLQALNKARAKNQYDIQNRALQYLMLLALAQGDINAATDILHQGEALLEIKEYATRYETYDILCSHYYIVLGRPDQVPDWLKSNFESYAHPAFLESYANRIRAHYRYLTRQYNTLLAFLDSVKESHTLLYGKIVFKVLEALSLYRLKHKDEAITALAEAYELAEPNKLIVPFTQYAKDMRTLTAAAMKDEKCTIPKPWLEDINRKSSAVARRVAHMLSESRANGEGEDAIKLTEREIVVLRDLSQGLSRTEIAASQNISVNTVKMVINSIYDKLCVTSLHDALRIAIARKLI
ncbi:MAG: LuxR C-terminal-related transcriptional regulator [Oscillospiraceae bacterium]|nr:LuxR C-terminal-related transcriptional regulator [Oscillospiraceae bacterium]MCL2159358.1 LuxR C-terminal-related transcriptional regulator [Oscillospiraceae bacterium]